ncbi:MAG: LCP family protein, partial [Ktedonobacteraceae bacterium]
VVMVARVDPLNKRVSLVSIPRDSWVPVPVQAGKSKLDQAFFLGATPHRSFDDGVRLARATIEQNYGIPIDRYAWVGLAGFASVIDTLGGVDIDLTHPLMDDTYPDDTGSGANPNDPYALMRLYLPPGPQHLNGKVALEYVRSRHADLIGDIGRTERQQQVLAALRNKLNASNVFEHLPQLLRDLTGKVYTDLSRSELLSMANFARNLSPRAISRITLGPGPGRQNYGSFTRTNGSIEDGPQDIVIPNCANNQPNINENLGLGDVQSSRAGETGG